MVFKGYKAKIRFVEVHRRKASRLPPEAVDSLCCKAFANDLYLQLIYKVDSSSQSQIHSLYVPF